MSGPYRHISVSKDGDILILTLELEQVKDYIVAEELRSELVHAAKRSKAQYIIVDLQRMRFMTSLACVSFIGLKSAIRDQGARLVLCNMTEMILKVFNAKRLLTPSQHTGNVAFEAAGTVSEAINRFAEVT